MHTVFSSLHFSHKLDWPSSYWAGNKIFIIEILKWRPGFYVGVNLLDCNLAVTVWYAVAMKGVTCHCYSSSKLLISWWEQMNTMSNRCWCTCTWLFECDLMIITPLSSKSGISRLSTVRCGRTNRYRRCTWLGVVVLYRWLYGFWRHTCKKIIVMVAVIKLHQMWDTSLNENKRA